MQIAPGLHRLGDGRINAYLLADGPDVTLIDAGVPGYWGELPAELTSMGRTLDDIHSIVLTHGHSDHIGFADRARRDRGWTVRIHEADAALARGETPNPAKGLGPVKVGALLSFLWYAGRRGGLRTRYVGEVATFGDGATLDVPGSPRVVLVPGHTPGSAALHVVAADALFVGDALATRAVTTGATGPMIAPFTADAAAARRSLERLRDIEARWLLPGHGQPWTQGVGAAIDAIPR